MAATASRDQARVLWIALVLNAGMFVAEMIGSYTARSVSLRADAMDFLGDAANYGASLYVLHRALNIKAKASLLKAGVMALFGLWVLASAGFNFAQGALPEPAPMGAFGLVAFAVNLFVAAILYKHRGGDSNMLGVWLCSRNDAIQNLAVIAAAGLVGITGAGWPDLAVAVGLGLLALRSSYLVVRAARRELAPPPSCC